MLDRDTPAPLYLLLSRLISYGVCFCLVYVDESCLKLYPWTILHPTLPWKYVLVNFLFCNCLVVEGPQSFYIVLLTVWLFFPPRWVFWLARTVWRLVLFWSPSNLTLVPSMSWTSIWIFPPHKILYCLGSYYAPSSFLAQRMISHCSLINFFCVSNICSNSFQILSVWNGEKYFSGDCIAGCRFFEAELIVFFVVCLSFLWCSCLGSLICTTIVLVVKHVFKRNLTCLTQLCNKFSLLFLSFTPNISWAGEYLPWCIHIAEPYFSWRWKGCA